MTTESDLRGFSSLGVCFCVCASMKVRVHIKTRGEMKLRILVIFVGNVVSLLDVYNYYLWIALRSPSSISSQVGAQHMSIGVLLISRMNKQIE